VWPWRDGLDLAGAGRYALEEYPTTSGPADYALVDGGRIAGIVEAKKVTVGAQNVLGQSQRYARGVAESGVAYGDLRVPFLYSTNGAQIWFEDVRLPDYRRRELAGFHTPGALAEALERPDAPEQRPRSCEALPLRHRGADGCEHYPALNPIRRWPRRGTTRPATDAGGRLAYPGDRRSHSPLANQGGGRLRGFPRQQVPILQGAASSDVATRRCRGSAALDGLVLNSAGSAPAAGNTMARCDSALTSIYRRAVP
jgi:hypothetical protein